MAIREELRDKYKSWRQGKEDVLNNIFDRMSDVMTDDVRKSYRKAAKEASNMAEEMGRIADSINLSGTYREIWKNLDRESRRALSELYKSVWDSAEGEAIRKKLVSAALKANISELYYYAAHGMYAQLAKKLGLKEEEVPHNFAGAAKLVAAVKGIKSAYKKVWI